MDRWENLSVPLNRSLRLATGFGGRPRSPARPERVCAGTAAPATLTPRHKDFVKSANPSLCRRRSVQCGEITKTFAAKGPSCKDGKSTGQIGSGKSTYLHCSVARNLSPCTSITAAVAQIPIASKSARALLVVRFVAASSGDDSCHKL